MYRINLAETNRLLHISQSLISTGCCEEINKICHKDFTRAVNHFLVAAGARGPDPGRCAAAQGWLPGEPRLRTVLEEVFPPR
jgi:hypothetical protein